MILHYYGRKYSYSIDKFLFLHFQPKEEPMDTDAAESKTDSKKDEKKEDKDKKDEKSEEEKKVKRKCLL